MTVKLRFRFNQATGEVEEFLVEQEVAGSSAEHERNHDRIAATLGRLIARAPGIDELPRGAAIEPLQNTIENEEDARRSRSVNVADQAR